MKKGLALLLALLGILLLCAAQAETLYEEKTIVVGTPAIDAGVNIRERADPDSRKVGQITPGSYCTVTGKAGDWYSVEYNGVFGYIRKDLLSVSKRTIQVERIVEDPLEAECKSFSVPYMLAPGKAMTVSGKIKSNIPIVEVRLTIHNLRSLRDEAAVKKEFTRESDVHSFDLSAFSKASALSGLSSGEKEAIVTVYSASESQEVARMPLYISGKCADAASMTSACTITVTHGSKSAMLDDSYATSWTPSSKGAIKITIPEGRNAGGLLLEWDKAPQKVQLDYYAADGTLIETIKESNPYGKWNLFYTLSPEIRAIQIRSADTDNGICKLRVYEEGRISPVVQQWEDTPERIDMMLVCAHMNDETLYFSGTLAKLSAQGYNVLVVYMTGDTRLKHAEALDCLWSAGVRVHPVFIGFMDYKVDSYAKAEWLWGSENTYRALIGAIRKYKPNVVMTHDWNGEYGHNQHIMTSRYTVKSVEAAGTASVYPDIAAAYGVWDVPKLYLHLHDKNKRLDMHFYDPMEELGGRSPMEMAFITFDKHQSQIKRYSLRGDGVTYDCTWFGLYRSLVGEDVRRNSFFENLEGY